MSAPSRPVETSQALGEVPGPRRLGLALLARAPTANGGW